MKFGGSSYHESKNLNVTAGGHQALRGLLHQHHREIVRLPILLHQWPTQSRTLQLISQTHPWNVHDTVTEKRINHGQTSTTVSLQIKSQVLEIHLLPSKRGAKALCNDTSESYRNDCKHSSFPRAILLDSAHASLHHASAQK